MSGVPKKHRWVFWEADAASLDTTRHGHYILARILEFGAIDEVRWAIARFGLRLIHAFFHDFGHVEISERTRRFWRLVLHAEEEPWADPGAWRRTIGAPWIS